MGKMDKSEECLKEALLILEAYPLYGEAYDTNATKSNLQYVHNKRNSLAGALASSKAEQHERKAIFGFPF